MKFYILGIIFITTLSLKAQIYKGKYYGYETWVEIKKDSANIFYLQGSYYEDGHWTVRDSIVPLKMKKIKENKAGVYIKNGTPYLVLSRKNKGKKIKLERDSSQRYLSIKQNRYKYRLEDKLYNISDSLNIENGIIGFEIRSIDYYQSLLTANTIDSLNQQADSIMAIIDSLRTPEIDNYYTKINRIDSLTESEIEELLNTSNYNQYSGSVFLSKLAHDKPELLIRYLNTKPFNEKRILKNIRWSKFQKQINQDIRKVKLNSRGKRKILKQSTVRMASVISQGTVIITLLTGEIVGFVALVNWII